MSAREEILARVREALGDDSQPVTQSVAPSGPQGRAEGAPVAPSGPQGRAEGAPVAPSGPRGRAEGAPVAPSGLQGAASPTAGAGERGYRTASGLDEDALVELLVDRLVDYKARVEVVGPDALAGAIRTRLEGKRFVVPEGLPSEWLDPSLAGVTVTDSREAPIGVERLDELDGVVTSSAVSIAETGTIILDGSPDQGRRAISLVPDHHVCVVPVETIVGIVPEGFARLDTTRPLTLISGPSATSDIELERVEGVHGPRTLDVIIVR